MKTPRITVLTLATTLATLAANTRVLGQDDVASAPLRAPAPPPAAPVPPPPAVPDIQPILDGVLREVGSVQEQVAQAVGGVMQDAFAGGAFQNVDLLRSSGRPGRPLVILSSDLDVRSVTAAEEDLNIMSRVLDKALPGKDGDKAERRAMGIAVSSPGGGSGAARNLYLEGYGALFFMDVRFPLLPPAKKEDDSRTKEATSSEWEEARNEIYSSRPPEGTIHWTGKASTRVGEEYDADKVERLKEALVEALKNGTHIRALKPDDWVTVVVQGGDTLRAEVLKVVRSIDAADTPRKETKSRANVLVTPSSGYARRPGGPGVTTMTIRVKKSDIDAFAKGAIDFEAFKTKAKVRIY